MKKILTAITLLVTVMIAGTALAQNSIGHSGQSLTHSGQSVKHSIHAAGHGLSAGAKLTSGVIAVPISVMGAVSTAAGYASTQVGNDLWNASSGEAFELTDHNLTNAGLPPHKAIQE